MISPSEVEVWKQIPGEPNYEVSTFGNVRSIDRVVQVRYKDGTTFERKLKGKLLTPQLDGRKNYLHVQLGKNNIRNIHRLVALTFIPNPKCLPEVNHIDENKTNNRVDNLEWCDRKYNATYGNRAEGGRGANNSMSKIDQKTAQEIKDSFIPYDKEFGVTGLAKKYGLSQTHVCAITKGRRWGWL